MMGKVQKKVAASKKTSAKKSAKVVRKKTKTARKKVAASVRTKKPEANIAYVLPLGNGWVVKNSNAKVFLAITDSKSEAISIGRKLAQTQHTELVVHGKQGNVEKEKVIL